MGHKANETEGIKGPGQQVRPVRYLVLPTSERLCFCLTKTSNMTVDGTHEENKGKYSRTVRET